MVYFVPTWSLFAGPVTNFDDFSKVYFQIFFLHVFYIRDGSPEVRHAKLMRYNGNLFSKELLSLPE